MGKMRILLKGRRHFPTFSTNTFFSFQSAIVLLALTLYKHSGAKRPYSHYPSKHHQQSFNNEKTEKSKHISITNLSYKWAIKQIIKIRRYHNECYTLPMSRAVLRHVTLNFCYNIFIVHNVLLVCLFKKKIGQHQLQHKCSFMWTLNNFSVSNNSTLTFL